jgi:hypothetical protein
MALAWRLSRGAGLLLGLFPAAPAALAQKVAILGAPGISFGFPNLRARGDAEGLVPLGQLVKIYLWPIELGGKESVDNLIYVTPEAAEAHAAITGDLRRFLLVANENEMEIRSECEGGSVVPTRIRFSARHKRGGPRFERVIEVWHQTRLTAAGSAPLPGAACPTSAEKPVVLFVHRPADFARITSPAVADAIVGEGQLVNIMLFPIELGGPEDPHNIAYIPPEAEEDRQRLIARLKRLTEQDQIDSLEVLPEYRGASIIPSRIRYVGRDSRGGAPIEAVIDIW